MIQRPKIRWAGIAANYWFDDLTIPILLPVKLGTSFFPTSSTPELGPTSWVPRSLKNKLSLFGILGSWVQISVQTCIFACAYSVFAVLCTVGGLAKADLQTKDSYRLCKKFRKRKLPLPNNRSIEPIILIDVQVTIN